MSKKTILIVEDEKGMREALRDSFEGADYEVEVAADGEEALDKITKVKADVVLLDIILPKKDGFEVLEEMKKMEKVKDIPVVLCTNLSQSEDIQRALDAGATTYLVKANYSLPEIIDKVEKVLEK